MITFSELIDLLKKEITKLTLNKCIQLAEKYKLSGISTDEITEEIKTVRHAKSNR